MSIGYRQAAHRGNAKADKESETKEMLFKSLLVRDLLKKSLSLLWTVSTGTSTF